MPTNHWILPWFMLVRIMYIMLNKRYQNAPDHRTDLIALMYMLPPHYPTGTINRFASGISVFDILKAIVARKMCKVTKDKWRML